MVHAAIVADLSVCDQTGSRPALPTMMRMKGRSGRPYLKLGTHDITPRLWSDLFSQTLSDLSFNTIHPLAGALFRLAGWSI